MAPPSPHFAIRRWLLSPPDGFSSK